jgi:hypothetical protein
MSDTGSGIPQGWNHPEPPRPATGPGSSAGPVPYATSAGTPPASTPPASLPAAGAGWLSGLASDPAAPGVPESAGGERRRKRLLIGGIVGAVVVVGIVVAVLATRGGAGPTLSAPSPSTIVLSVPTPTIAPVARTASTAFAKALPSALLQYALAASVAEPSWVSAGAIEAYSETYSDGGAGKIAVLAGQWETPAAADAYAKSLVAAIPAPTAAPGATGSATASAGSTASASAMAPETGNVTAGGQTVGTYTIRDAGDGTGVAIWTNGASVFRATAPAAETHNVYAAYPL